MSKRQRTVAMVLRTMCFSALLLASQTAAMAQSRARVTIKKSNTTIVEALKQIEKQTGMFAEYNHTQLNKKPGINVNLQNATVDEALNKVLSGSGFSYQIKGDQIIIVPADAKEKQRTTTGTKQQGKKQRIQGRVLDKDGMPLIGVSVRTEGAGNEGTVTDMDGNFSFEGTAGRHIVVSYIGYKNQTLKAGENMNVVLQEDSKLLGDVVVTALGIKREQKALSYNVQQVKGDDLLANKDANFINSLNGKVAGVNINASSGGAGAASKVVMRGARSIEQSSNVLYVIDGVPMFNLGGDGDTEFGSSGVTEAVADINPEDVESMSVLTGAAAAALYGNRASNGAIVITTKKGQAGKTNVTVSQSTEFSNAFRTPEFQNRYGTGSSLRDAGADSYSWGKLLNDANRMGYDPVDDYLKTGVMTTEAVTVSTGTDKNQTYFSASAVNSAGIVPNNKYNRYNFTFRNTTSMLGDRLTLDAGASYVYQNDRNMVNQGVYSNPLVTAYLFPRGNDWEAVKMYEHYDTSRGIYTQNWNDLVSEFVGQNPYWVNYRNVRTNSKHRYMLNVGATYKITKYLNIAGRIRVDNATNKWEKKYYATTNQTFSGKNGAYGTSYTDDKQIYGDVMMTFDKRFFDDKLSVNANVGAILSDIRQNVTGIDGNIADDLIPNVFNEYQVDPTREKRLASGYHDQTKSLFASAEIGWANQLYLSLTGRNDWPSMLAGPHSNKSSFFYPSVGLSWLASETFNLPKQIDYLKLRGSFASVGIPFPRWYANPVYEWDADKKQWKNQMVYPMYNLKPETTDSWEFGLQARLFKHFNIDLTLYWTKTFNQTFNPGISVSSGYSKMYVQTGSVSNNGIELAVGYNNKWGDFAWASNFTLSHNKNKINELVENYVHPETGAVINMDRIDVGGLGSTHFILKTGGSLGDLYSMADLVRTDDGKIYVDENGKVYKDNNVGDIKLGSVFPKCNMSWRNDFSWKGLNLGFQVTARLGGIVYSATQAALDSYGVSEASAAARDRGYVLVNGNDMVNPEVWYSTIGGSDGIGQYYTYSATNVRLQEASIGYTFKKNQLFGIGDLTVSLVGRNLFFFYCKAPFDPESTASTGNYYQGIDKFMTPNTRTLGFNIKLKF